MGPWNTFRYGLPYYWGCFITYPKIRQLLQLQAQEELAYNTRNILKIFTYSMSYSNVRECNEQRANSKYPGRLPNHIILIV